MPSVAYGEDEINDEHLVMVMAMDSVVVCSSPQCGSCVDMGFSYDDGDVVSIIRSVNSLSYPCPMTNAEAQKIRRNFEKRSKQLTGMVLRYK